MGRVWRSFAAWGIDVLILLVAVVGAIGTVLRTDPQRPGGAQLWFEVA